MLSFRSAAIIALACLLSGASWAEDFPNRPITIVVPLGAGGSLDIITRTLAPKLEAALGKPIVVENRVGGGTVTAAVAVANAAPDGHTLLFAPSGTLTTNATLYKKLPYDPARDFVPIAMTVKVPFVLVINPQIPAKTMAEFITWAKAQPQGVSYGSTGTGAVPHLATEMLRSATGMQMTHVPYKGAIPAMTDVVAGHVQLTFADPSLTPPLVKDGKLQALGVSSLTRMGILPDVPPLAEAGVPGFEAVSWHMLVAPAATPKDVVAKLHTAMKNAMADATIRRQVTDMGLIAVDTPSVDELSAYVKAESVKWGEAVRKVGIAGTE